MYRSNEDAVCVHPLMTLVHWPTGKMVLKNLKVQKTLDVNFANYAAACNLSLAMKANCLNCKAFDMIHHSVYLFQWHAPIVLDICDRFLEFFGPPLAGNAPSTAWNFLSYAYKVMQRITGMGGVIPFAIERGMLEMCCLGASH